MKKFLSLSIIVLLLSFIIFGSISVDRGQDNGWDLKNYHFYNPYSFFNDRLGFDYAPAQVHTYLNPTADFMFYFFVMTFPPKLVGFLMGGIQGLNFWLLFLISYYVLKRIYPPSNNGEKKGFDNAVGGDKGDDFFRRDRVILGFSFLIGVVGLYGPVTFFELGLTYNDNLVSLFILGAILVLVQKMVLERNYGLSEMKKELIISGILVGIGIGLKLTQVSYGIGIILAIGVFKGDLRVKLVSISLIMVSMFVGVLISSGYWMFLMWTKFENPIFPFYNEVFRSPYYTLNNINILRLNPIPRGLIENLLYPFYFFFDSEFSDVRSRHIRDARYAIVYSLLMLSIFRSLRTNFRRNFDSVIRKSKDIFARVVLSLLLYYTAIFPVMQAKQILERRITFLDLTSHLSTVNVLAYLIYISIAFIVFFIVKNMELRKEDIGEKSADKHSKQVVLFLLTFFIGSFITWQIIFTISRYLSPLEFLSPLIIVILLMYLVENITLRNWFIFVSFILIIFGVVSPQPKTISWNKTFFRVQVPDMKHLDSSIVLIAGIDPIAYLIPFFPPGARFIRLESHWKFNNPGVETKFHEEIKNIIKNHDNSFYLLSDWNYFTRHEQLLKNLGLSVSQAESESIYSEHETSGFRLWAVRKEKPKSNVKK